MLRLSWFQGSLATLVPHLFGSKLLGFHYEALPDDHLCSSFDSSALFLPRRSIVELRVSGKQRNNLVHGLLLNAGRHASSLEVRSERVLMVLKKLPTLIRVGSSHFSTPIPRRTPKKAPSKSAGVATSLYSFVTFPVFVLFRLPKWSRDTPCETSVSGQYTVNDAHSRNFRRGLEELSANVSENLIACQGLSRNKIHSSGKNLRFPNARKKIWNKFATICWTQVCNTCASVLFWTRATGKSFWTRKMFCNTFASSVSETRNTFASSCAAVAGRPNQHRNVFATSVLDRRNKMVRIF